MFDTPSESAIAWGLAVLTTALGGGMLLLHGFAKSKAARERMLEAYDDMLRAAREDKPEQVDGSRQPESDT